MNRLHKGHHYIYDLICQGEHQQQDFKFEISDARKIAKSLSAFSNTEGGRLLVGVKDNGKIAGVRSEEEIYMIEAAARLYSKPVIDCEMHTHEIEGRTVLEVIIPKGEQGPYYAKDEDNHYRAYIRIKDENILALLYSVKKGSREFKKDSAFCRLYEFFLPLIRLLKKSKNFIIIRAKRLRRS